MIKVAIFASGSGSNAENIINYFAKNQNVLIDVILSNKENAYVHERAKYLGVESFTFTNQEFSEGESIKEFLRKRNIDYIILAGFLLKIPQSLIEAYPNRIMNIHPALLPKYGGKGMYGDYVHKAVVEAGEKESGITIHYVNENYDEGNIIFQAKCEVLVADTYKDVAKKIHALEYKYFPETIEQVILRSFE